MGTLQFQSFIESRYDDADGALRGGRRSKIVAAFQKYGATSQNKSKQMERAYITQLCCFLIPPFLDLLLALDRFFANTAYPLTLAFVCGTLPPFPTSPINISRGDSRVDYSYSSLPYLNLAIPFLTALTTARSGVSDSSIASSIMVPNFQFLRGEHPLSPKNMCLPWVTCSSLAEEFTLWFGTHPKLLPLVNQWQLCTSIASEVRLRKGPGRGR